MRKFEEIKDKIKIPGENYFEYQTENTYRSVGTRLSPLYFKKFGNGKINSDTVKIKLHGSAGQSLGAFLTKGLKLIVEGDSNDYVGKGLSGGSIIVPHLKAKISDENTIIGNTVFMAQHLEDCMHLDKLVKDLL